MVVVGFLDSLLSVMAVCKPRVAVSGWLGCGGGLGLGGDVFDLRRGREAREVDLYGALIARAGRRREAALRQHTVPDHAQSLYLARVVVVHGYIESLLDDLGRHAVRQQALFELRELRAVLAVLGRLG